MSAAPSLLSDTAAARWRERAKTRLYVMCQICGWAIFFATQWSLTQLVKHPDGGGLGAAAETALLAMNTATGLLLTHFSRRYLHRAEWTRLGWLSLVPRTLGFAAVLALMWVIFGYGFEFGVLRMPWQSNYHPLVVFCFSWFNAVFIMLVWLAIYFSYQLYDRFSRSELERVRLGALVQESQLQALKSQVNPHFMFNSLNTVRALIDEDPRRARDSVTRLANLLRYALQSGKRETVALRDELQVVQDYLALEQVRHEERLTYRLTIDEDMLDVSVPPMLLQTLVENAVKYGVATRPEGGEIVISASWGEACLQIMVTNPGRISTDRKLNPEADSTGLGLSNASSRLQLLFGEQASIRLLQSSPEQVSAEVTVPVSAPNALTPDP